MSAAKTAQPRSLEAGAPPPRPKLVHWFTVPASLREQDDGTKLDAVGIMRISVDDELHAAELSADGERGLSIALMALRRYKVFGVDRVVSVGMGDGSAERLFKAMPSPLRQMLLSAISQLHEPRPEDMESFFGSRRAVME